MILPARDRSILDHIWGYKPMRSGVQLWMVDLPLCSACGSSCRFASTAVDSPCTKSGHTGLLRCTAKDVRAPGDLKTLGTSCLDYRLKPCFQQRPGNSTSPQIDMLLGGIGNRLLHEDIADLETTTRLEYSVHLRKHRQLIRTEIDHTVGDDYVHPVLGDG